jgi:putative hydrolase of HD superfamily
MLRLLLSLARMKAIPRSGWISHGVALQDVESVADHTFSTCALALLLADLEVKRGRRVKVERVLRIAVLHDMPESLTFDISKEYLEYLGQRGEAIKGELEHAAWKHLASGLKEPSIRRVYTRLMKEFDAEQTIESRIVHAADRLDILLQVIAYRRRGYPQSLLGDLWNGTNAKLRSSRIPSVREIQRILIQEARRPKLGKFK